MRRRFQDLGLAWKLLLPFVVVIVFLGSLGSFFVVRYLANRAQDALDQQLFSRTVQAETSLLDRSLYLLDGVRLGANFEGVPESVAARDVTALRRLVAGVPALRTELDLVVATDAEGRGLVEVVRSGEGYARGEGGGWATSPFVRRVLESSDERAQVTDRGFIRLEHGGTMLAVVGPITARGDTVGAFLVGIRVERLARGIAEHAQASVSLFSPDGRVLARAGEPSSVPEPPREVTEQPARLMHSIGDDRWTTAYSPMRVDGRVLGTTAVTLPRGGAASPVFGASIRLISMLLAAMAAVFVVGLLLSRFILKQVQPLLDASRRFGSGGLLVRAPILSGDEIGELARGFNAMADRVQASYEELEDRVAERTEELTRLNRELSAATKSRAELYAMVSHDLRSPLAAIIGHAQMLLDARRGTPGDRRNSAWSIKLAGEELLARTNELLDLAKLESGTLRLELDEVALSDVVDELHGTVAALAERARVKTRIELPEDLPGVRADRARLRQIVLNLISNALKYTPPGGTVTVGATARRGWVDVSVSDTGVGIPRGIGRKVFEPFYQVRGIKAQKGQSSTGLGLSLARLLVETHGGRISYQSNRGDGTTFAFTLRAVGQRRAGRARTSSRSRRRAGVMR